MKALVLRFRLAGVPVQVEPSFWFIAALLGLSLPHVWLWVACVFVGVLVHEMGHALVAQRYGATPEVTLYAMGGVTRSILPLSGQITRFASAMVTLAGPMAGFALGALLLGLERVVEVPPETPYAAGLYYLKRITILWGLINLAPILPLDGGNLLRLLLSGNGLERGLVRALWVSSVLGVLTAVVSVLLGESWVALLAGFFAFSSIRQLMERRHMGRDRSAGLDRLLEEAHDGLSKGDLEEAYAKADAVSRKAKTQDLVVAALHMMAFIKLEQDQPHDALDILAGVPEEIVDPMLRGASLLTAGRAREAVASLERAVAQGRHPQAPELLARAQKAAQEQDGG